MGIYLRVFLTSNLGIRSLIELIFLQWWNSGEAFDRRKMYALRAEFALTERWEATDYYAIIKNLITAKLNIADRFPVAFDPPLDTTI